MFIRIGDEYINLSLVMHFTVTSVNGDNAPYAYEFHFQFMDGKILDYKENDLQKAKANINTLSAFIRNN